MRARAVAAVLLATGASLWRPGAVMADANRLLHSVSATGQFSVYSTNLLLNSELCMLAESLKRQWLKNLNLTDSWRDPVILVVHDRAAGTNLPAIRLQVFATPLHLKYQLDCVVPPPLDEAEFGATLIEALCAEYANRNEPVARAVIPAWLAYGLAQSLEERSESLLVVARRSAAGSRPQTASALLAADAAPTDPVERRLFRANAWLWTESLMSLPHGRQKLTLYLQELGKRKTPREAFPAVYEKDFPNAVALEKWWSVYLTQRTSATVAENFTAEETIRRLDAILRAKPPTNTVETAIDQLWPQYEQKWFRDMLQTKLSQLQALRILAHPRYLEVIGLYNDALRSLSQKKLREFHRSIAHAKKVREAVDRATEEIAIYLDRVERRLTPINLQEWFGGYFQILDQSSTNRVHDPIGDYLDKFDR